MLQRHQTIKKNKPPSDLCTHRSKGAKQHRQQPRNSEGPAEGVPRRVPEGWPRGFSPGLWGSRFFFSPSPTSIFILFVSLKGIGGVIESRDPQMCTFGVLGLSCEAPAAPKPPGLSHDSPCTFQGPGLQKHHRRHPERHKRAKWRAGEGVRESAQILDEPTKILNTHHNTTQQHNNDSTGLGQGGSIAGWSMVPKTRHEQQIVPNSSPHWPRFFWGQ